MNKIYNLNDEVICEDRSLRQIIKDNELFNETSGREGIRADLTNANLSYVVLCYANLRYVNLTNADLRNADLTGAYLADANLTGANLTGANLTNAELAFANLKEAKLDLQIQEGLLQEIGKVILSNPEKLQMNDWHGSCGTTHCLSGWAEEFNPITKELVKTHGNEIAGLLTLGIEAHSYFFKNDVEVLKWLKTVIK